MYVWKIYQNGKVAILWEFHPSHYLCQGETGFPRIKSQKKSSKMTCALGFTSSLGVSHLFQRNTGRNYPKYTPPGRLHK